MMHHDSSSRYAALIGSVLLGRYTPLAIRSAVGNQVCLRAQDLMTRRGVELEVTFGDDGEIDKIVLSDIWPRIRDPDQGASPADKVLSPVSALEHHAVHAPPPPGGVRASFEALRLESAWFAAAEREQLEPEDPEGLELLDHQERLEALGHDLSRASFDRLTLGKVSRGAVAMSPSNVLEDYRDLTDLRRELVGNRFTLQLLGTLAIVAALLAGYLLLWP